MYTNSIVVLWNIFWVNSLLVRCILINRKTVLRQKVVFSSLDNTFDTFWKINHKSETASLFDWNVTDMHCERVFDIRDSSFLPIRTFNLIKELQDQDKSIFPCMPQLSDIDWYRVMVTALLSYKIWRCVLRTFEDSILPRERLITTFNRANLIFYGYVNFDLSTRSILESMR